MNPEQTRNNPTPPDEWENMAREMNQQEAQRTMADRAAELARTSRDQLAIAYHGLRAAVADWRVNRAGSRMERMDHKNALYSDLGHISVGGKRVENQFIGPLRIQEFRAAPTANGNNPAMPRSFVERYQDKKLDQKSEKRNLSITDAALTQRIFGPKETLPGTNKKERRQQHRQVNKGYRKGQMTASERRRHSLEVDAAPLKLGDEMHKKTSGTLKKATKDISRSMEEKRAFRWRSMRRHRAINAIQKHHYRAEDHRDRIDTIRNPQA